MAIINHGRGQASGFWRCLGGAWATKGWQPLLWVFGLQPSVLSPACSAMPDTMALSLLVHRALPWILPCTLLEALFPLPAMGSLPDDLQSQLGLASALQPGGCSVAASVHPKLPVGRSCLPQPFSSRGLSSRNKAWCSTPYSLQVNPGVPPPILPGHFLATSIGSLSAWSRVL